MHFYNRHFVIVDEDDIDDFFYENPEKNEIDLFTVLFNRMCGININICVFSSDNINIVFTNKTDFSLLMENGQNVLAFGKAEYESIGFSSVRTNRKEVLIYANGRLFIRKDIE